MLFIEEKQMAIPMKEHTQSDYDNLYNLVSQGIPPRLACEYAGFDRANFKRTMNDGAEDYLRGIDSPEAKFYSSVLEGRKFFTSKVVGEIMSNEKDSVTKMKLLAKFEKDDFGEEAQTKGAEDDKVVLVDAVPIEDEPKQVESVKEIPDANDNGK